MLKSLMALLGHKFDNLELLQKALTHRSFYFENRRASPGHFERLEFLGDAILDLVLSEALMNAYPEVDEGSLSKWRASLVNEVTLAEVARDLNLGQYLNLGRSEECSRDHLRARLLASSFEAILAALYLDAGLGPVKAFIEQQFASRLTTLDQANAYAADFKTKLQEQSQKQFHSVPDYRLVSSEGPDHAKTFVYEVYVNNQLLGRGTGNSRKIAEQEAAANALNTTKEISL